MSDGSGAPRISRARSIVWSMGGQVATTIVSVLSAALLARLLKPVDFGAFAFGVTISYLTQWLLQAGMGNYVLREGDLTQAKIDGAFAVAMGQGLFASLIVAALAPVAGWFSDYTTIGWVTLSVAIVPLLGAPETINDSLWLRDGRYAPIALLQVAKGVAQALVSIAGVLVFHWGVFALVAGTLAFGLASFLVSIASLAVRYRARPVTTREQWRALRQFGGRSLILTLSQVGALRLPELMIGRLLSVAMLGHYNRATGALDTITRTLSSSVARAAQPRFYAQVNVGQPIKEAVAELCDVITFFVWPATAGIALLSEPLIRLLYGPQWGIAASALPLLCLSFMIDAANTGGMETMLMRDRLGLNAKIELVHAAYAILFVILAAPFGLKAILWSRVANVALNLVIYYGVMRRLDALPLRRLGRIFAVNGLLAAGASALPALLLTRWGWPETLGVGGFALVIGSGVAGWLVVLVALRHRYLLKARAIVASRLGA